MSLLWVINNSGRLPLLCVVLEHVTKDLQFKWLQETIVSGCDKKWVRQKAHCFVNRAKMPMDSCKGTLPVRRVQRFDSWLESHCPQIKIFMAVKFKTT